MGEISNPSNEPTPSGEDRTVIIRHQQVHFSGPLPAPEILKQYEKLKPGFADRIFTYAETEQANRHAVQHKTLDLERQELLSSLWMHIITNLALVVTFTILLATGCYALKLGHVSVALAVFAVPVVRMAIAMTKMHHPPRERNQDNDSDRAG